MVNVRAVERDQQFLMPPSVSDWLPEDHLAWFVLDMVAELDLAELYSLLRTDGRGGASYHPEMMLGVLLYAYCVGNVLPGGSNGGWSRMWLFGWWPRTYVPTMPLWPGSGPVREAISGLFSQVLGLCVAEGLVETGVVAIDSNKVEANASAWSNRTRRQIADEILDEAEAVDAAEDEQCGDRRGGELPDKWTDRNDRRSRLREALRQLDSEGAADWESYMAEREAKEAELGRKLPGRKPRIGSEHRGKTRQANVTDPDSRMIKARNRFLQGYNAQAAVSEDHIVVAAETDQPRKRLHPTGSHDRRHPREPDRVERTRSRNVCGRCRVLECGEPQPAHRRRPVSGADARHHRDHRPRRSSP